MQIKDISKLTGFTKDTIRWYEKIGLLKLDKKSRTKNNYRTYSTENLSQLLMIKQIKSLGFTLKDIEMLFLLDKHDELNCNSASGIFQNRLEAINKKIVELEMLKSKLLNAKNNCTGNCIQEIKENSFNND